MGCFSYLCTHCGKGIKSSSFDGEECRLTLLVNGEVEQVMEGEYDSYGRVFKRDTNNSEVIQWNRDWGEIVDLHFNSNPLDGINAQHLDCIREHGPDRDMKASADDPNQGWEDDDPLCS